MEDGDTKETTSLHRHTAAHQQHSSSEVRSRRTDHHRSTHDHHRPPSDLQTNDPEQDDRRSRFQPTEALPVHHHRSTSSSPPPPTPLVIVRYKECMKNHAPLSGRHVIDGCGEFMPRYSGDDDGDFRCAACDCHRNFHRQEIETIPPPPMQPPRKTTSTTMHHHGGPPPPVMMMNFGGVGGSSSMGAESSSEDRENLRPTTSYARKRYRTKFSKEQKEMMADFAERIGWRIQKQDESEVHMFCSQIGVKRKVFKVWMHNNRTRQSAKGKQM